MDVPTNFLSPGYQTDGTTKYGWMTYSSSTPSLYKNEVVSNITCIFSRATPSFVNLPFVLTTVLTTNTAGIPTSMSWQISPTTAILDFFLIRFYTSCSCIPNRLFPHYTSPAWLHRKKARRHSHLRATDRGRPSQLP